MGRLSSRDRKLAHLAGQNVSNIENRQFATLSASASQTILQGPLPVVPTTGFQTISGTVYWTYIGYTQKQLVVDYVRFIQTAAAVGTQAAEVYLATTPDAPDGTAKTLTVTYVNATLDNLVTGTYTAGLVKGNATAAAFAISPATHLWAAARFAFTTTPTQPVILGHNLDLSVGYVQATTAIAGPMVVGDVKTGVLYTQAIAATALAPMLRVVVKS
jgi:hypothetical protein